MSTLSSFRTTASHSSSRRPGATPGELVARIEGRLAEAVDELEALRVEVAALAALATKPPGDDRMAPRLLTVAQAGAILGVGQSTVHHLIRTGEHGSRKLGGSRRIPVEDLDAFIAGLPSQPLGA